MFKVIWSVFSDCHVVVPYNYGNVLPKFDGSFDDCVKFIESNLCDQQEMEELRKLRILAN